eukprot:COSAG02_NODE_42205_length_386_cov_1.547038_1_plen_25_part_10
MEEAGLAVTLTWDVYTLMKESIYIS